MKEIVEDGIDLPLWETPLDMAGPGTQSVDYIKEQEEPVELEDISGGNLSAAAKSGTSISFKCIWIVAWM